MGYEIGEKVWFKGDEYTITTVPYSLHGGEFQDATDENGKTVTVPTPEARTAQAERVRSEYKEMQAGFRSLAGR
jgi:hypothetical protein